MVYKSYGGHVPDYADRGSSIVATAVVCISVSTFAVFIRFWSRLVATRMKFWWDDAALLATLVFSNAYLATMIWWTTIGYGKHMYMLPMSAIGPNTLASHLIIVWYIAAINLIKLSALTLYGRLFRISRSMIYILWTLGVIVTLWLIASEILPWFNCHPLVKTIHPMVPGDCWERVAYYRALGLINPILDVIILLLPMPIIWKLSMTMERRLLVTLGFVLGYSSAFLSLARFGLIFKDPHILSAGQPGADPTWNTVPLQIISMLEAPIAIVALCGPPTNQIMRRAREFGWHSLFSTARFPTPVVQTVSEASRCTKPGSVHNFFGKVVRRKESMAANPRMPSLDMRILSSESGDRSETAKKHQGSIAVTTDIDVV